jgi:enoyl-CoA hydratase
MTHVGYRVDEGIAHVTLDSPSNRNALSNRLVEELHQCLERAGDDPQVRAVVLGHTGTTFCAGADLKEAGAGGGPAQNAERLLEVVLRILELPKPVIAVIDGNVRAGGLGIVGACDIALASHRASFGFSEVRIGVAPLIISLTTLSRLTERASSRYYLTGETFDAAQAAASGLVTVAAADVSAELDRILDALRLCSPASLAETKSMTTREMRAAIADRGRDLVAASVRLFNAPDAAEGILAFRERRAPSWSALSAHGS